MFGKKIKPVHVPVNTQEQAQEDPLMRSWVMGGNPNAIVAQEAEGQQSFVNSDTLPTRTNDYGDHDSKKALEAAGVKFGVVIPGDPLFQYVELPKGWKKVPTSHSMWSDLVDDKGRKRASIFYKAAFYDRDAFYSATSRFSIGIDYERQDKEGITVGQVLEQGAVIHTTEPVTSEKSHELSKKARKVAAEWLDEHYPD
ncbi:hypothetical protein C4577_00305 [Candidatus Parcubacteria bacterium]|nr:MAG: hypothetical protein C4577_00305 [Candidatus Parcubacteria bacterium]